MQNITSLRSALRPVFDRHYTEKVYAANTNDGKNLNLYIVGCTRATVPVIKNEIASALHHTDGVTLNHVEAEIMIDSSIRGNGILLYDRGGL